MLKKEHLLQTFSLEDPDHPPITPGNECFYFPVLYMVGVAFIHLSHTLPDHLILNSLPRGTFHRALITQMH